MTGTYVGTGHAADAQIFVHMGNAVDDLHGAVFAGLDTGAVAQAAELAGHGAVAADFGGGQAVLQALVVALDLRALG